MRRYILHVRSRAMASNWNGLKLVSLADARCVGMRFVGDLLKELKQFSKNNNWSQDVTKHRD